MPIDEIDFTADNYQDIVSRDSRYDARAYAFLTDVLKFLTGEEGRQISGEEIMDEFRERALDQYGPLAYTVLTEWGVKSTEDIGELLYNLIESHRFGQNEGDSKEDFVGGYDFKEAFLDPYQT